MNADTYQEVALRTVKGPAASRDADEVANYAVIGLAGEAGEVAEAYKRVLRMEHRGDDADAIAKQWGKVAEEIGDVLWYCALLANAMGMGLGEIMEANNDKLKDRHGDPR